MKMLFGLTIVMLMTQVDAYYGYNAPNYNALYSKYDAYGYPMFYDEKDVLSFYGYHMDGYYNDGYFVDGYTTQDISSAYYTYTPTYYSTTIHETMPPLYGGSRKMLSIPSTYSDYSDDYNNGVYDEKSNDGDNDKDGNNNDYVDTSSNSQSPNIPSPFPTPPPPTTNGVARMSLKWFYYMSFISALMLVITV